MSTPRTLSCPAKTPFRQVPVAPVVVCPKPRTRSHALHQFAHHAWVIQQWDGALTMVQDGHRGIHAQMAVHGGQHISWRIRNGFGTSPVRVGLTDGLSYFEVSSPPPSI